MATEVQREKYEEVFGYYDTDNDGEIVQSDIDALIASWTHEFGVTPGSDGWRRLVDLGNRLWSSIEGHDVDGDKKVSKEEFTAAHAQPGFVDEIAIPLAMAAFDLADTDNDGQISIQEWLASQKTHGLGPKEAVDAFQSWDTDGDGYLSRDEYRRYTESFYKDAN
ncbi:EF-hand domain-containing protein [Actinomadura sp. NPDC047616]|uniref:EF-hand domain-containing protein n=1 Tax=Actinomadura sp. NPDC047616 TaxID=3155914 RepID=UPI0033CD9684